MKQSALRLLFNKAQTSEEKAWILRKCGTRVIPARGLYGHTDWITGERYPDASSGKQEIYCLKAPSGKSYIFYSLANIVDNYLFTNIPEVFREPVVTNNALQTVAVQAPLPVTPLKYVQHSELIEIAEKLLLKIDLVEKRLDIALGNISIPTKEDLPGKITVDGARYTKMISKYPGVCHRSKRAFSKGSTVYYNNKACVIPDACFLEITTELSKGGRR